MSSDWIDHHPDQRNAVNKVVPFLPATLMFVFAIMALCGVTVYAVLIGSWRWGISGVVIFLCLMLVGSALQSYGNRRAK